MNLFIVGSVASGKNTLMDQLKKHGDFTFIDTGLIYRYLTREYFTQLNLSFNILDDEEEMKAVKESIYKLTKFCKKTLSELSFKDSKPFKGDVKVDLESLYSKNVNNFISIIAKIPYIRNNIVGFLNEFCGNNENLILTGHNIKEIDTSKFMVVYLDVSNKVATERLFQRNRTSYENIFDAYEEVKRRNKIDDIQKTKDSIQLLYKKVYISTDNLSENEILEIVMNKIKQFETLDNSFVSLQSASAITRNNFEWIFQPMLIVLKNEISLRIERIIKDYPFINKNDLIYQVLITLSAYKPQEIFFSNSNDLDRLCESIINRDNSMFEQFYSQIKNEIIKVNYDLVNFEIGNSTNRLLQLYIDNNTQEILTTYNTISKERCILNENEILSTHNPLFRQHIHFKKIDSSISDFLSEYCHYLHTPRTDELISYGAFIDNSDYPIAYTSFSRHDRDYKKQLLDYLGIEAQNSIEMTRAWCSNSSPQNIMSSLFQYAITDISKSWSDNAKQNLEDKNLQAITTTINPNLGFKASSFLGCNFMPIALRPAGLTYIKNGDSFQYYTRRLLEKNQSFEVFNNQMPLLPLNELILPLNRFYAEIIACNDIMVMDKENYSKVLKRGN